MFKTLKMRRRLKKLERTLHVNVSLAFKTFEKCLNDNEIDYIEELIDKCDAGFEQHVTFEVNSQNTLEIVYDNGKVIGLRCTDTDSMQLLNSEFIDKDAIYRMRHLARLCDVFEDVFTEALWIDLCHSTVIVNKQNNN
jgi:hypothetical protein